MRNRPFDVRAVHHPTGERHRDIALSGELERGVGDRCSWVEGGERPTLRTVDGSEQPVHVGRWPRGAPFTAQTTRGRRPTSSSGRFPFSHQLLSNEHVQQGVEFAGQALWPHLVLVLQSTLDLASTMPGGDEVPDTASGAVQGEDAVCVQVHQDDGLPN